MCMPLHAHEWRGESQYGVSLTIILHFLFWHRSVTEPRIHWLVSLAGQRSPGIHLSYPNPQYYGYTYDYTWLLCGFWGSQLRSLFEHAMHSNWQSHLPNVPCFYYYMTNCEYTNYFWFMMKLGSCHNLHDFELQTKLVSFPEDSILLKKNTWQVWLNLRYIQMGTGQTFSPMQKSP